MNYNRLKSFFKKICYNTVLLYYLILVFYINNVLILLHLLLVDLLGCTYFYCILVLFVLIQCVYLSRHHMGNFFIIFPYDADCILCILTFYNFYCKFSLEQRNIVFLKITDKR